MRHVLLFQRVVLQIPLHGVHFRHGIADRGAGGEYYAASGGQLVHVPAFQEHIRGLLRLRGGKAGYIAHFCGEKQILVPVRFVHKKPIHTQLRFSHTKTAARRKTVCAPEQRTLPVL